MTTGSSLRIGEAVLGGLVLGLGVFVAFETWRLATGPVHAAVGPKLFPYLIATGLILVGAAVLREALVGHIAHEGGWELDWGPVALVSAGLIAEMLLLEWAGWIIAATVLFLAVTWAFGSRRLVVDAAIGVVLTTLAFVVFSYGLGLGLPGGIIAEQLLSVEEASQ